MKYQFRFSDKDDGYLKIRMNGEPVTMNINGKETKEYHGKLASHLIGEKGRNDQVYYKFGLYRDNYDYGIKLLEREREKEQKVEDKLELGEAIKNIEKAKEDEKNGHPMTIYFKNYSIKPIEQSE